jgi:hypothetical protein
MNIYFSSVMKILNPLVSFDLTVLQALTLLFSPLWKEEKKFFFYMIIVNVLIVKNYCYIYLYDVCV